MIMYSRRIQGVLTDPKGCSARCTAVAIISETRTCRCTPKDFSTHNCITQHPVLLVATSKQFDAMLLMIYCQSQARMSLFVSTKDPTSYESWSDHQKRKVETLSNIGTSTRHTKMSRKWTNRH